MTDPAEPGADSPRLIDRLRPVLGLSAIGIVLATIAALVALAVVLGLVRVVVWWLDGLAAGG